MSETVSEFRRFLADQWMMHEGLGELMAPYRRELDDEDRRSLKIKVMMGLSGANQPFQSDLVGRALEGGWLSEESLARMITRIQRDEDGKLVTHPPEQVEGIIPQILRLAHPIAALEQHGPPEALETLRDAVLKAMRVSPPPDVLTRHVEAYASAIGLRAERLRAAEAALDDEGLTFNHRAGRVERRESGPRGYGFRRQVFVALSRFVRGGDLTNDQSVREDIAGLLAGWFSPEDLDPRKGEAIDRDLKNEMTKLAP